MRSPLHQAVGDYLTEKLPPRYSLIKDEACGGSQRIPLFCSAEKHNATEFCDVDLLILKNQKIVGIIEIEETDIKPTQLCGKFLTSALSKYYIHQNNPSSIIELNRPVMFVQVLNTSNLKQASMKLEQFKNIEKSIKDVLPIHGSHITDYRIIPGSLSEFPRLDEQLDLVLGIIEKNFYYYSKYYYSSGEIRHY